MKEKKTKICIVGGGKVGFYMAKTLLEHDRHPVVIEPEAANCERIANRLDIPVICGDGTTIEVLEAAGCDHCTALVAVTGNDETNLISCQLAKRVFNVPKTVARVNNPKNTQILKALGVDIPVSNTDNLARLLEREVETAAIQQLLSLAGGTASLTEILIPDDFKYAGKNLMEIQMPPDTVVISVTRDNELLIPRGTTCIFPGDKVLTLAKATAFHALTTDWGLEGH